MTGYRGMSEQLKSQYTGAYGPYCAAEYAIGDQVKAPYVSGKVIWSFRQDGTGPLTYVVDAGNGDFPVEVPARSVSS